ncbi:hypothetical protein Tco_0492372 [Tanacetum coccineum]
MGDIPRRGKEHHIVEAGHLALHTQEDNTGPTTTTTLTAKIITSRTFLHGQIIGDMMSEGKKLIGYKTSTAAPTMPSNVGTRKKENLDRYCDYHGEKGHYTNDCYQLKRQLEATLKFGKLGHLVKDVRQRGGTRGRQHRNNNGKGKMINMGVAVQVMFEHCFDNLPSSVKARLTPNQTELVWFSREHLIPMDKIDLEVAFGSEGLYRRTMMKFTVVRASSSYNIILGRTRMRELRAIPSTTRAMMKFPTPRGIAALVTRTAAVFECRRLEEKQIIPEEKADGKGLEDKEKLVEK